MGVTGGGRVGNLAVRAVGGGLAGASFGGVGWGRVGGFEFCRGGWLGIHGEGAVECDEFRDGEFEWFDTFSGDGGDGEEGDFATFGHGGEFFELVGVGDVGLGGDQDGWLGGEGRIKGFEFFGDDFVVVDGVGAIVFVCPGGCVGDIDEVDDDAGSLDVLEELDAEAVSEVCAFDETGEVCDGEGLLVGPLSDGDDSEVWFEGGEGVVGDFGFGGGEARDEGGFAYVGVSDEASVGEEAEFEAEVTFFSGAAEFVLAGGLVGAGGEVLVATAAAATTGDDDGVVGAGEVVDEFAGIVIEEEGSDGDLEGGGLACVTGAVGAEAVTSALGFVLGVEAEVDEGVVGEGGGHDDVTSVTTVSAGGAATGDELFATEGHAAVTAISGFYADSCFINKHFTFQCNGRGIAWRDTNGFVCYPRRILRGWRCFGARLLRVRAASNTGRGNRPVMNVCESSRYRNKKTDLYASGCCTG